MTKQWNFHVSTDRNPFRMQSYWQDTTFYRQNTLQKVILPIDHYFQPIELLTKHCSTNRTSYRMCSIGRTSLLTGKNLIEILIHPIFYTNPSLSTLQLLTYIPTITIPKLILFHIIYKPNMQNPQTKIIIKTIPIIMIYLHQHPTIFISF